MKIRVKIEPSETQPRTIHVSLEDLGINGEAWHELNDREREVVIDEYIGKMDQPYWNIDSFKEVES